MIILQLSINQIQIISPNKKIDVRELLLILSPSMTIMRGFKEFQNLGRQNLKFQLLKKRRFQGTHKLILQLLKNFHGMKIKLLIKSTKFLRSRQLDSHQIQEIKILIKIQIQDLLEDQSKLSQEKLGVVYWKISLHLVELFQMKLRKHHYSGMKSPNLRFLLYRNLKVIFGMTNHLNQFLLFNNNKQNLQVFGMRSPQSLKAQVYPVSQLLDQTI